MSQVFVVDTGYLLELFAVPGHSSNPNVLEVRRRFGRAYEAHAHIYVPAQCIYELANLVAHVSDGHAPVSIARQIDNVLVRCFDGEAIERPWNIVPSPDGSSLPSHWRAFVDEYSSQAIGLTDVGVIIEAKRLKDVTRMGRITPFTYGRWQATLRLGNPITRRIPSWDEGT